MLNNLVELMYMIKKQDHQVPQLNHPRRCKYTEGSQLKKYSLLITYMTFHLKKD